MIKCRILSRQQALPMVKWMLTLFVALIVLGLFVPHLKRWVDFGRLPGDVQWRFRGKTYVFPFTSTLLLSALLALLSQVL